MTRSRTSGVGRYRPAFEVVRGWAAFFAVLATLGVVALGIWYVNGGATGFLLGSLAVGLLVVAYSISSFR